MCMSDGLVREISLRLILYGGIFKSLEWKFFVKIAQKPKGLNVHTQYSSLKDTKKSTFQQNQTHILSPLITLHG